MRKDPTLPTIYKAYTDQYHSLGHSLGMLLGPNADFMFDIRPQQRVGWWEDGRLPYLTGCALRCRTEEFLGRRMQLVQLSEVHGYDILKAHIDYLNTAPAKEHPGFKMVSRDSYGGSAPAVLRHLIKDGLDLDRHEDCEKKVGPRLYEVLLNWEHCNDSLAKVILEKKLHHPEFLHVLAMAFRHVENSTDLNFVKNFDNTGKIYVFVEALKKGNMSLANLALLSMEPFSDIEEKIFADTLRKYKPAKNYITIEDLLKISLWEVQALFTPAFEKFMPVLYGFFNFLTREGRLVLFWHAIEGCPNLASLVLLQMESLSNAESHETAQALRKYSSQNGVTNPLWKVRALFTARFKHIIAATLANPGMVTLYLLTLRLNPSPWDEYAIDFFIKQQYISEEFKDNLKEPVFDVIGSMEHKTPLTEHINSLGVELLRSLVDNNKNNKYTHQLLPFFYYAMNHFRKADNALNTLRLTDIRLGDGGQAKEEWSDLLEEGLKNGMEKEFVPSFNALQPTKLSEFADNKRQKMNDDYSIDLLTFIEEEGLVFERVQGRTLIFRNSHAQKWTAIKIQKTEEDPRWLERESDIQSWLSSNKESLGLLSDYPTPVQCGSATNLRQLLEACLKDNSKDSAMDWLCKNLIGNELETKHVLIYNAAPSYFTYLHAIDDWEKFKQSSRNGAHDLFVLLKHGIYFDTLADMFHNIETGKDGRADGGRYSVLLNLLRPWRSAWGSGRLNAWLSATEYLNLRESGLADVGDIRLLVDEVFPQDSEFAEDYLRELFSEKRDHPETRIFLNCIAEYLYVFFLAAGRRARIETIGMEPEKAFKIWKQHAEFLIELCAESLVTFCHQDLASAKAYLSGTIDPDRLARQMKFWMTKEYHQLLKDKKIPVDELYGSKVTFEYDRIRRGTFNDKFGFCINEKNGPDLGPANGQEPIKEFNKLLYITTTSILSAMHHDSAKTAKVRTSLPPKRWG